MVYGIFAFFGICRPFSVDLPAKMERVWLFKVPIKERNVPLLISVIIIIALTGLDQLTKHLATVYLAPVGAMPFIPGVMELRYVLNDGAAFSMLADAEWGRVFLIVVTGLALAALAVYFFWKKPSSWLERWVFILIFSGGLGNLIDRVLNGYVVDFFATTFMNFAVFNVADCFVCVGAALFVIAVLRQLGYSEEKVHEMMAHAAVPSTRHGDHQVGGFHIITQMSKGLNAFATSRAFDYIAGLPGQKELFLMINDQGCEKRWSENVCWLYDTDFEFLNRDDVVQIVCTGKRGLDYKLRMLLAGIPAERICYEPDDLKALELLQFRPGDEICLLHDVEVDQTERIYNRLAELAEAHSKHEEVQA